MPSLNLSKLIRRNLDRPTIKERAAALKASASRVMRRPAASAPHTAIAPSAEPDDSALFGLEAEFMQADFANLEARIALDDARRRYVEPEMPMQLHIWRNDWFNNYLPRTRIRVVGDGTARAMPYGREEVEQIRGVHCLQPAYGSDGELQPDGRRAKPDTHAQERVDGIVSAWDAWQTAIQAAKAELQIPELSRMADAAYDRRYAVLVRVLETPALTLVGLGVKARIAGEICGNDDVKAYGLETYGASEEEALPFDIAGDVLNLLAGASGVREA